MPHISNMLPLPGVGELESVAKALIALLKDEDGYPNKGATLMEQLESIAKWAGNMGNLVEFTVELHGIRKALEAANKSKSRQRKLAIWGDLTSKLKQKISCTTLSLTAQLHKSLNEQALGPSRQHQIIKSYQIMDDVEVYTNIWPKPEHHVYDSTGVKPFRTTLRSGQFERVRVSYLTFAADSEGTVQKRVEEQMECILQLNHVNVAKFVGVTEGYGGLDGIVVAMDGIEFDDFLSRTHSGAVWAECIRGFEAFAGLAPKWMRAERITVGPSGHVMILPAQSGRMATEFGQYDHARMLDPGVELLVKIYAENRKVLGPIRLRAFIDSLVNLGLGFTELDVMKLAADCGLFPFHENHNLDPSNSTLPGIQLHVGGIGQIIYSDEKPFHSNLRAGWQSLGRSSCVLDEDLVDLGWANNLEWCKSMALDGAEWFTYITSVPYSRDSLEKAFGVGWFLSKTLNQPFRFDWKDIFSEAREISERFKVDLSNISFLSRVCCAFRLSQRPEANWDEIPVNLYYHWSPQLEGSPKDKGFYSAEKTPDGGAWQERLKIGGWNLKFEISIQTYRMGDDWGLQYERELKRIMEATPGSYPLGV